MKDKKIDYKKLRDSRTDKNLTQKEMAAKLNIEQSAYSRIEKGTRGLRVEQLTVIAQVLGKNMNELLKENKMNNNPNTLEALKVENEFLMSMLFLVSTTAEDELFGIMYGYENQHPTYQLSFEEYIVDFHSGPADAVSQIKDDIKNYKKNGEYPFFYKEWSEQGIEYFVGKSDEWLINFVKKEENYEIVCVLLHFPSYTKPEDMFSAFKDMLKENPLVHKLFQYGLLEKSWYSFLWEKYLLEMKPTPSGDGHLPSHNPWFKTNDDGEFDILLPQTIDLEATSQRRQEREFIREKMRSILKDKT